MDFEDLYCPEPNTNCWIWTGCYARRGYGVIGFGKKKFRAHRYSWELNRGPIPTGMHVLHKCDCPPCINPDHLFLGTQLDNNADMDAKGRRGHKLTESDVLAIRTSYKSWQRGSSQRALAHRFGMSNGQIQGILSGLSWGWLIDGPLALAHKRIWRALPRRNS